MKNAQPCFFRSNLRELLVNGTEGCSFQDRLKLERGGSGDGSCLTMMEEQAGARNGPRVSRGAIPRLASLHTFETFVSQQVSPPCPSSMLESYTKHADTNANKLND